MAKDLQMSAVQYVLEDLIVSSSEIETYSKILTVGHQRGLTRTVSNTLHAAAKSFHHFIGLDGFLEMPEEVVAALFANDDLEAIHEGAACDALMRWLNHSGCITGLSMLESIRFPLIESDYIARRRTDWLSQVSGHCNATALSSKLKDLLLDARHPGSSRGVRVIPRSRSQRYIRAWQVVLLFAALGAVLLHRQHMLREQEQAVRASCVKHWKDTAVAKAFRSWKDSTGDGLGADARLCCVERGAAYLAVSAGATHVTVAAGWHYCVCVTASARRLTVTLCSLAQFKRTAALYKEYVHNVAADEGGGADSPEPRAESVRAAARPLSGAARWATVAALRAAGAAALVRMVQVAAQLLEARRPLVVGHALLQFGAAEVLAVLVSLTVSVLAARLAGPDAPAARARAVSNE